MNETLTITVPEEGRPTQPTDSSALIGIDSNAFNIMGATRQLLRRAGASREFLAAYARDAMSGNYDHLLAVSAAYLDCNGGASELAEEES